MPKIPLNDDPTASGNIVSQIVSTVTPTVRVLHEVTKGDLPPSLQTKIWIQTTCMLSVVDATLAADLDQDSVASPDPNASAIQIIQTAAFQPLATVPGIACTRRVKNILQRAKMIHPNHIRLGVRGSWFSAPPNRQVFSVLFTSHHISREIPKASPVQLYPPYLHRKNQPSVSQTSEHDERPVPRSTVKNLTESSMHPPKQTGPIHADDPLVSRRPLRDPRNTHVFIVPPDLHIPTVSTGKPHGPPTHTATNKLIARGPFTWMPDNNNNRQMTTTLMRQERSARNPTTHRPGVACASSDNPTDQKQHRN